MKTDDQKSARTPRKRVAGAQRPAASDDLRDHYDFDYSKARPNRFAGRVSRESVVVVLEPDCGECISQL